MDLIGYSVSLNSLINRYIVLIIVQIIGIVLLSALLWVLPCFEIKMIREREKRDRKKELILSKKIERRAYAIMIIATIFLVAVGSFFISDEFRTLNTLKFDQNQNSIAIYEGDAELMYSSSGTITDIIVDPRIIKFENSDDIYWIDMSRVNEGWNPDSGEFYGKITYAENSKFILKIE